MNKFSWLYVLTNIVCDAGYCRSCHKGASCLWAMAMCVADVGYLRCVCVVVLCVMLGVVVGEGAVCVAGRGNVIVVCVSL